MYMLTLSADGAIGSTTVYANVVDATDDYAETVGRNTVEMMGQDLSADEIDGLPFRDEVVALLVGGEPSVSTYWHDTRDVDGTHTVEIDDTTPNYRATLSRVSADDVDTSEVTFVPSRAVVIPDEIRAEIDTVTMAEIMADVAREFVAA